MLAPEDIIIHKLISNRPQDDADIVSIFRAEHALDWDYLNRYVKEWQLESALAFIERRYENMYESSVRKIQRRVE